MGKALLLVALLSVPMLLDAQSCELRGSVRDTRGVVIANASIELRNEDTGVRRGRRRTGKAHFVFARLKAGTYQATVRAQGFKALTRDGIRLDKQQRARLELTLQAN